MEEESPNSLEYGYFKIGVSILSSIVVLFLLWMGFSTWESFSIAQGRVIASTFTKHIQAKYGGMIENILVKEGQTVNEGDLLVEFDSKAETEEYQGLMQEIAILEILQNRLTSELASANSVSSSSIDISQHPNEVAIKKYLQLEQSLLRQNLRYYKEQNDLYEDRKATFNKQLKENQILIQSLTVQIELIDEELKSVTKLHNEKLVGGPRLYALKREKERLVGSRQEARITQEKTQAQYLQAKSEQDVFNADFRKKILDKLESVTSELFKKEQDFKLAKIKLDNTKVYAPFKGTVFDLKFFSRGEVARPGDKILSLAPIEDSLIVEGKLPSEEISSIHAGLKAYVSFTPYKYLRNHRILGQITYVAADATFDETHKFLYYRILVGIDHDELLAHKEIKPYLGMPVEIYIVTGERTPFTYFLSPIVDRFQKSFRER